MKKTKKRKDNRYSHYIKILASGFIIPTLGILVIALVFTLLDIEIMRSILYIYLVPFMWGLWNLFYYQFLKGKEGMKDSDLFLIGAALGFIDATIEISVVNLPEMIGMENMKYVFIIIFPLVYGLLWTYVMKKLNKLIVGN
ncbi:MAG: hypothetical protein PHW96_04185 [Candidatus Nanoarchaeia archaeon]|nr:hypothetical protein [Candidatus Nanoarchaeia archaeon]